MVDDGSKREARSVRTARLWECPRCGAKTISKNLSHACGPHSIERFLGGKTEVGRELFEHFVRLIERTGAFLVAPAKTRVAFMGAVRFASVNRVGRDFIDVHFVLPRALVSPRFRKVERFGKLHVHHVRLRARRDFDRELARWLSQSSREYGWRGWLRNEQDTEHARQRPARTGVTRSRGKS